jgi:hypothetical protein
MRYRVGIDRFKWLALMAMLQLKKDNDLFDDLSIDTFFESIILKIPDVKYKNPLACIIVYYVAINEKIQFEFDSSKLNYIQNDVLPNQELLFQAHGLKFPDLIRYLRLFESTFSP